MRTTLRSVAAFAISLSIGCSAASESPSDFSNSPATENEETSEAGPASFENSEAGVLDGGNYQPTRDPQTCDEAATTKSYVGCDFWPTVTPNPSVNSCFDFTVVVANTGDTEATVTVTGPSSTNKTVKVAPNSLEKIYLPWVEPLKMTAYRTIIAATPTWNTPTASVSAKAGAFHLKSSVPVTVYQFNPLEYKSAGGPAGKDWNACNKGAMGVAYGSYSNDASLLLPATALTGNYRLTGFDESGVVTITATADNTKIAMRVGANAGSILSGGGIAAAGPGQVVSFSMNAGDVTTIASTGNLGGSLITADHPVQAIAANLCAYTTYGACDHIEEAVHPAETLGKHYVVSPATSASGKAEGQLVYFYGNVDGTKLTYAPSRPQGCPETINAGEMIRCDKTDAGPFTHPSSAPVEQTNANLLFNDSFEVTGDHEFAIATFQKGGSGAAPVDPDPAFPMATGGDPAQSVVVAIEQYRSKYVFLAPDDYRASYADVIVPTGTKLSLDGAPITATPTPISTGYGILRLNLTSGNSSVHHLEGDRGFGLQVVGYGSYTSYQYPGGLNLGLIAPPPPLVTN